MNSETESDITWVEDFLSQKVPRGEELVLRDPLQEDECRWFRAAIENQIVKVRECVPQCNRFKKWKELGPDEFFVTRGKNKGEIRHLFSLSKPAAFNREYLPHIAAYARLILETGYNQEFSSFSLYRKFSRNLLSKKKGGDYETDAEFYDADENPYLHVEAKKSPEETEALAQGLNVSESLADFSKKHAKELEYVLDLKPKYIWIVGPNSVDPERYVYSVKIDGLNAKFDPCNHLPNPPSYG